MEKNVYLLKMIVQKIREKAIARLRIDHRYNPLTHTRIFKDAEHPVCQVCDEPSGFCKSLANQM